MIILCVYSILCNSTFGQSKEIPNEKFMKLLLCCNQPSSADEEDLDKLIENITGDNIDCIKGIHNNDQFVGIWCNI